MNGQQENKAKAPGANMLWGGRFSGNIYPWRRTRRKNPADRKYQEAKIPFLSSITGRCPMTLDFGVKILTEALPLPAPTTTPAFSPLTSSLKSKGA